MSFVTFILFFPLTFPHKQTRENNYSSISFPRIFLSSKHTCGKKKFTQFLSSQLLSSYFLSSLFLSFAKHNLRIVIPSPLFLYYTSNFAYFERGSAMISPNKTPSLPSILTSSPTTLNLDAQHLQLWIWAFGDPNDNFGC